MSYTEKSSMTTPVPITVAHGDGIGPEIMDASLSILKEAGYSEMLGKRFLTAVGELCQLAGWTAADAGLPVIAQRYYAAGIHAAYEADNTALGANLISSLSYLYSNVGNLGEAVLLAHTAYAGARHRASAATQALLQERITQIAVSITIGRAQLERLLKMRDRFFHGAFLK